MALVDTFLARDDSQWADAAVTGLSVAVGDLLVVLAGGFSFDGDGTADPTIASTNMGSIVWTEVTVHTAETNDIAYSIFYGLVLSATAAGTVNISGSDYNFVEVHKFTGHDAVTPVNGKGTAFNTGVDLSITLDAAPASGDIAINGSFLQYNAAVTAVPGSSFVEIVDSSFNDGSGYYSYQSQNRTGSTSTACTKTFSAYAWRWASAAIVVKAASAGNWPLQQMRNTVAYPDVQLR